MIGARAMGCVGRTTPRVGVILSRERSVTGYVTNGAWDGGAGVWIMVFDSHQKHMCQRMAFFKDRGFFFVHNLLIVAEKLRKVEFFIVRIWVQFFLTECAGFVLWND
jgi:hypothetical protein